jgi:hypothetical protein
VVPAAKLVSLTSTSAEFVFAGRFEGRQVFWQCQLQCLASVAQASRQTSQRQFIEILPCSESQQKEKPTLRIRVGLNVPEINPGVIEKTIIMIRNYKRLQIGRHEYGESFEFSLD